MRRGFTRLLWCSWILLIALLLTAHLVGQLTLWTSLLVYAPVTWWMLGGLIIACLAVPLSKRLALVSLLTAIIIGGPLWEYRTHHPLMPQDATPVLRVLTCNRGQHNGHTLAKFIAEQQPDVIAYQETNERGCYLPDAPEYAAYPHRSRVSEFQLLSRHPIVSAGLVTGPQVMVEGRLQPANKVARFELDTPMGHVVLYNLHLLSPRFEIRSMLKPTPPTPTQLMRIERFPGDQEALLEDAMQHAEREVKPTILCGDFNVPSLGPLYRRMTRQFQDSQVQAGCGYGFSFPGDVTAPLTGGQWIRIDYVLANRTWEILRCKVEQQSGAQHSAILSTLRLR